MKTKGREEERRDEKEKDQRKRSLRGRRKPREVACHKSRVESIYVKEGMASEPNAFEGRNKTRRPFGDTDDLSERTFSRAVGTEMRLELAVLPGLIVKGSCLGVARESSGI